MVRMIDGDRWGSVTCTDGNHGWYYEVYLVLGSAFHRAVGLAACVHSRKHGRPPPPVPVPVPVPPAHRSHPRQ